MDMDDCVWGGIGEEHRDETCALDGMDRDELSAHKMILDLP